MENKADNNQSEKKESGFKAFAAKRIILAAVLIIAVVWALGIGLNFFDHTDTPSAESKTPQTQTTKEFTEHSASETATIPADTQSTARQSNHSEQPVAVASPSEDAADMTGTPDKSDSNPEPSDIGSHPAPMKSKSTVSQSHTPKTETASSAARNDQRAESQTHAAEPTTEQAMRPRGVTFVEAVIQPIDYELNKRFWGWRPNDIVNVTDNINNFQLGVLEVTRRATIMLSERISRTGSTDSLNPHLENAANWLMVTATRYWIPSPESKYKECIKELEDYKQELIKGSASFHIRTDNIIPLLASFEDLLGSCDENLVKQKNEDGSNVSFFKADDYFFYAKGVASAMATILEAVHYDFLPTLENRHGAAELLHHALTSCRQASSLSPLLITNTALDGILANHRANMAAPISHARFYIGQLIKTLST
jgi:hypothetical protein